MFVNFSNHPSDGWPREQKEKAIEMGNEIVDIAFPNVKTKYTTQDIHNIAEEYVEKICRMNPDVVMCQGETTLCYSVVTLLKKKGIKVVAATTERESKEIKKGDSIKKTSMFKFSGFREYIA